MVSGQLWSRRFSLAETKEINKRIADDGAGVDDEQPFLSRSPFNKSLCSFLDINMHESGQISSLLRGEFMLPKHAEYKFRVF